MGHKKKKSKDEAEKILLASKLEIGQNLAWCIIVAMILTAIVLCNIF